MQRILLNESNRDMIITEDRAVLVSSLPFPPNTEQKTKPFRQFFTADGTETGSEDMRVDGSVTKQFFYIESDETDERYVTAISFEISDAGAVLNEFGNIGALTNGCRFYYVRSDEEKIFFHKELKTNWDFVRLCLGVPAFGDAAGAFRANNISGTSEGYIPVLDLLRLVPPFGIKLDAGTRQRMVLSVRDNLMGVDSFNVIAYGFDRFE